MPDSTFRRLTRRPVRSVAIGLAGVAAVIAGYLSWPGAPTETGVTIQPLEITEPPPYYTGSFAYQYAGSGVFLTPADAAATVSGLIVLEDGKPLGPAHSPRADIYANGLGRYSHFTPEGGGTDLIFSTSDNTDPRRNGRTYVVADVLVIRAAEITAVAGHLYRYSGAGVTLTEPDDLAPRHRVSRLRLFEDGKPLPQPHAEHELIIKAGLGRYSHWRDETSVYLNFSTTDNTDPRTNGRTYTLSVAQ
jgi:hypothetical protein